MRSIPRLLAAAVAALAIAPQVANAATFTVTTTANAGACSLRQAINDANGAGGGPHTIAFAIPGAGPHTIAPTSPLPDIGSRVTVDGYSQPGAHANTLANGFDADLRIDLAGTNAFGPGFTLSGSGSTVRGLIIEGWNEVAVETYGPSNRVEGSILRQNAYAGVSLDSTGNTVGGADPAKRNVIASNGVQGVNVASGDNTVAGNFIGLDTTGTADAGNAINGVFLSNSAPNATVRANVIAGNDVNGVDVSLHADAATISGNRIGTNAAGTGCVANSGPGIKLEGAGAAVTDNDIG